MEDPTDFVVELEAMGDEGTGPRPRAEPDQVVRQTEKGADGKFVGRKAGAVAAPLVDKNSPFEDETQPTLAGSVWQADLMDMNTKGAAYGYALVAVDVASRKSYGALMTTKTPDAVLRAWILITTGPDPRSMRAESPSLVDMDQERGFRAQEVQDFFRQ